MPNLGQKLQALANGGLRLIEEMEKRPMLVSTFTQTPQYRAIKEELQNAHLEGHKLYK